MMNQALTPYKEAPALNVSLKARAPNVVYPPGEPPTMHNLSPSTFPLLTWNAKQKLPQIGNDILVCFHT